MKTLSCTQKYFLSAINEKGDVPESLATVFPICLIAGGTMELLSNGYITHNEKDVLVANKTWDDRLPHLQSLYEIVLSMKKPKKAKNLTGFIGALTLVLVEMNKKSYYSTLFSAIGESLVVSGCANKLEKSGLFKKTKYVPKEEAVKSIMKKIRTELLDDGEIKTETLCLTAFLDICGLFENHFSKDEMEDMKNRIEDVQKSEVYLSIIRIFNEIASGAVVAAMVVSPN